MSALINYGGSQMSGKRDAVKECFNVVPLLLLLDGRIKKRERERN